MKIIIIIFSCFFIFSCAQRIEHKKRAVVNQRNASDENYYKKKGRKEGSIHFVYEVKKQTDIVIVEVHEDPFYTDICRTKGFPIDNLLSGFKVQIVAYKYNNYYCYYYFNKNKQVLKISYSSKELTLIKKQKKYPKKIFEDLGVQI